MRISLEDGPFFTFLVCAESGDTLLVQFDADFPGVARTFGWRGTDDRTPESLWDVYAFLDEHVGSSVEDPGYF